MMYRYIEQRLEQRDFSVTDAIHLFEKLIKETLLKII